MNKNKYKLRDDDNYYSEIEEDFGYGGVQRKKRKKNPFKKKNRKKFNKQSDYRKKSNR